MLPNILGLILTCVGAYGFEPLSSSSSEQQETETASWTLFDSSGTDLCSETDCTAFYEEGAQFQALWTFPGGAADPALVFCDKNDLLFPDDVPYHLCPTDEEDIVWPSQFKFGSNCSYYLDGGSYAFTTPGLAFHPRSPDDFQDGRYIGNLSLTLTYESDGQENVLQWPTKTVTLLRQHDNSHIVEDD